MKIYDIIEALNSIIRDSNHLSRSLLILHRSMLVESVKVYKKFVYELWVSDGRRKKKVLHVLHIDRVLAADIEKVWGDMDKNFIIYLLNWYKNAVSSELVITFEDIIDDSWS